MCEDCHFTHMRTTIAWPHLVTSRGSLGLYNQFIPATVFLLKCLIKVSIVSGHVLSMPFFSEFLRFFYYIFTVWYLFNKKSFYLFTILLSTRIDPHLYSHKFVWIITGYASIGKQTDAFSVYHKTLEIFPSW